MRLSDKQQSNLVVVFLVISTLAVYWQVGGHEFIGFDDNYYVTDNKEVQAGLSWRGVKWAFTTTHAWNWHPLVWLSHMLDCQLYGLNPAGHHYTNVFFHIANSLLLFFVLKSTTGSVWSSGFVAGLFALHPLHVESVAWVSERKDVLSTFFWFSTTYAYVHYVRRPGLSRYLLVFLLFAFGLMSKQMLVTLPFVLILLDYWPLRRIFSEQEGAGKLSGGGISFRRSFLEKLPFLILSAAASLIIFHIQLKATLVKSAAAIPMQYRAGNAVVSYAEYIVKTFLPVKLGVLYPHRRSNLPHWEVIAGSLLLLGICVEAIRCYRIRRWFTFGWLWYLGTLVPVIGLVQVGLQSMADRYTYVPLTGLFIIITWGASTLANKRRYGVIFLLAGSVLSLSALSVLTLLQLSHWKNSISLYKHTVAVTTDNDIMHYNLGVLLFHAGEHDQAIEHWREAVRIDPDQPTIHKNLGILLSRQGKIDEAIWHYREVLRLRPNDANASKNIKELQERRRLGIADAFCNKARILAEQGKTDEAIKWYQRSLESDPNHAEALRGLEILLKNTK